MSPITAIRRAELTPARQLTRVNDQAVRRVLKGAGMEFIDADGGAREFGWERPTTGQLT